MSAKPGKITRTLRNLAVMALINVGLVVLLWRQTVPQRSRPHVFETREHVFATREEARTFHSEEAAQGRTARS